MTHRNAAKTALVRGIGLIEMAFFVLAMGMMVGAGAPIYKEYRINKRMNTTNDSVAVAKQALDAFYDQNGYYPCPAPRNIAVDHAGFGVATDCSKAVVSGVAQTTGRNSWKVRIGTLPVRTLGLPDKDIIDGWGHLLTYAVTVNYALPTTPEEDMLHGAIDVEDSHGHPVTTNPGEAVYVVVAAGKDGRGAYNINGKQPIACPAASKNLLVTENCNDNYKFRTTTLQSTYGSNSFTNVLAYGGSPCGLTGGGSNSVGNIMFFVDNSGSMGTQDIKNSNGNYISRMTAAHQALDQVIPAVINQKAKNDPTNLVGVANFSTYCSGYAFSCNGNASGGGCALPHNPPQLSDAQCIYNGKTNAIGYSQQNIATTYNGTTNSTISSSNYQTASNNLVKTVNNMQPTGMTPLYNSMIDTAAAMTDHGQSTKSNVLVVISDGGNNTGNASNTTMINTLATKYPNMKVDFVFVGNKNDAGNVKQAVFGKTTQGNQLKGQFIAVKNTQAIIGALTNDVNSCP